MAKANELKWKGYTTLRVHFINKVPASWTFENGEPVKTMDILIWANEWGESLQDQIPRFMEAKLGESVEVCIQFNSKYSY